MLHFPAVSRDGLPFFESALAESGERRLRPSGPLGPLLLTLFEECRHEEWALGDLDERSRHARRGLRRPIERFYEPLPTRRRRVVVEDAHHPHQRRHFACERNPPRGKGPPGFSRGRVDHEELLGRMKAGRDGGDRAERAGDPTAHSSAMLS